LLMIVNGLEAAATECDSDDDLDDDDE